MKPIKLDSIGGRVYQLMAEHGMSRRDLANKLFVDVKTVCGWINNDRFPPANMIISICKEFNVSADWLLGLKQ